MIGSKTGGTSIEAPGMGCSPLVWLEDDEV